jgi:hypothetical protein
MNILNDLFTEVEWLLHDNQRKGLWINLTPASRRWWRIKHGAIVGNYLHVTGAKICWQMYGILVRTWMIILGRCIDIDYWAFCMELKITTGTLYPFETLIAIITQRLYWCHR